MTLGMRIQQIRTEHGLSQEDFAEKLGPQGKPFHVGSSIRRYQKLQK